MRGTLLLLGMLALFAVPAWGKTLSDLQPGDHLQIVTSERGAFFYSVLERTAGDTLVVRQGRSEQLRQIPITEIQSLHLGVPRSPGSGALRGMLVGAAIGSVTGAVVALASHEETPGCGQFSNICETGANTAKVIGYIGIFGMAGMVAGALVGAAVPGSQWKPVELRHGLSFRYPVRERVVIQYALSF